MPAREQRHGEVERHDRVHRQHQRGGDTGQDEVSHLVVAPVTVGPAPAQGKEAVAERTHLVASLEEAVAEDSQVRQQTDIPEKHRNGTVGGDGEHVPLQRRTVVLPDGVAVRDGEQVPGEPDATDVEHREDTGANHGENRHRLGGAIDRGTPFLAQQAQDRRDQCTGVTDTDPEHEVNDVPGPVNRVGVAPNTDARGNEVGDAGDGERGDAAGEDEANPPPGGGLTLDDAADLVGHPTKAPVVFNQSGAGERGRINLVEDGRLSGRCVCVRGH